MKVLIGVILFCATVVAEVPEQVSVVQDIPEAFDYHNKVGIPEAARIKQREEANGASRIIGGSAAVLGQYPYQAGLVITMVSGATSACGASLLSNTRVVTAAHCWWDGRTQARQFVVVLGSVALFFGGTRITTSTVTMHGSWNPNNLNNDIAIISIPWVNYSNNIRNIALPTGVSNQNFAGHWASASGFGMLGTYTPITVNQFLSHVRVQVITNAMCQQTFSVFIVSSTICTSGAGNVGLCGGDSGGPLALDWGNQRILIGVSSFRGYLGCGMGEPSGYARVTSYLSWLQARL